MLYYSSSISFRRQLHAGIESIFVTFIKRHLRDGWMLQLWTWFNSGLVVLGGWSDLMTLQVFSNLNNPAVLIL